MQDTAPQSPPAQNDGRDLDFAVRLSALALLIEFALSWRTFVPGWHLMGTAPLIGAFAALPDCISIVCLVFAVVSVFWLLLAPARRLPAVCFLACEVFFCLRDIHQLQPWMIMYAFTLFAAAVQSRREAALNAIRIMVCCVYFWAGFHKLNLTFYTLLFPWFISPIHGFALSTGLIDLLLVPFIFITPFFESAIGVLLFFPRRRRLATAMAFVMLLVVLFCLGPFGHVWGLPVWPWNIYLFALEMRLFFLPAGQGRKFFSLFTPPDTMLERLSFVLFAILPLLALFTPWYSLPGFKLYSGNIVTAEIVFAPGETLARVPATLREPLAADHTLDMLTWFASEQKNGVYPVASALKAGAQGLCPYLDFPAQAVIRMSMPAPFYSVTRQHEDAPLCP